MAAPRTILACDRWTTNGHLIADVAKLGYLPGRVLDATWGRGTFWAEWRPTALVAHDLKLDGVDFRHLPHRDGEFDAVVLDPPYRLNGTPDQGEFDERYGIDVKATWRERHQLIRDGMTECARVLVAGGFFHLRCQDQVCSGAVRWQTDEFTFHGASLGLEKIDRFDMLGHRPQPAGRRQVHAQRAYSTLLVFVKRRRPRGHA